MSARSKCWLKWGLVFAVCMLLPTSSFSRAKYHKKHGDDRTVYDVTHYGAVADAVEATDCDEGEDSPFPEGESLTCGTPGTGTDNEAAFEAAFAAAGAAGGGTVYFPCGLYRIAGEVDIQYSNISVVGEGACSVILPDDDVVRMFFVCSAGACGTEITNFSISNITFRDDDPFTHGCQHCEVVTVENLTGAFDYAEGVTFTGGGGETAYFYWQSTAAPGLATMIYTDVSAVTVAIGDTIAGVNSTESADILTIQHEAAEESHAITFVNVTRSTIGPNVRFDYLGDEAINIGGTNSHILIHDNILYEVPGTPSKGGSISSAADYMTITNNHITLGVAAGPLGGNGGISITASSSGDPVGNVISNNIVIEPNDDADDHRSAEFGISVIANAHDSVYDTSILGNHIELDIDENGTCTVSGDPCDEDGDCGANYCDPTTYNPGCAGAAIACQAILVNESTNTIDGAKISDNYVNGSIYARASGTNMPLTITNNVIKGAHSNGILFGDADYVIISDNTISGHGFRGIYAFWASERVTISDNIISDTGADLYAGISVPAIIGFANGTTVDSAVISGNHLVGKAVGTSAVAGIDCRKDPDVVVIGNHLVDIDGIGIRLCFQVIDNSIENTGDDGIYVSGILNTVSGNVIIGAGSEAVDEAASTDYTRCIGNRSISTDLIDVSPSTVAIAALGPCAGAGDDGDIQAVNDPNDTLDCTAGGGFDVSHWCECDFSGAGVWQNYGIDYSIEVGDDISWNGAAEDGVVYAVDIDTDITIIPDDFSDDVVAATDEITDGTWQLISVAVNDVGTAGPIFDCAAQFSTEVDNEEIPVP